MFKLRTILLSVAVAFTLPAWALGQSNTSADSSNTPGSFDQVVDRIVAREKAFNEQMRQMHPLVETYIQTMRNDHEVGLVPAGDQYFLARLDLTDGLKDRAFLNDSQKRKGF